MIVGHKGQRLENGQAWIAHVWFIC